MMEDTEGFGSSLYTSLQDILDWVDSVNTGNSDNEKSLYYFDKIDELLILINNISNSSEFNIPVEDREELNNLSNIFNELRKELFVHGWSGISSNT